MAKIFYLLKQNKAQGSKIYGKWFAHGKTIETLNTRKMATHIAEHGSIYTPGVVFGVLEKFRSCLLEMLLNSKRVKIDGLGISTPLSRTRKVEQTRRTTSAQPRI